MTPRSRLSASLAALAVVASLTACSAAPGASAPGSSVPDAASAAAGTAAISVAEAVAANKRPTSAALDADPTGGVRITLLGDTAVADGEGVTVDGANVTITAPGTYVLTGRLSGQVVVAADAEGQVTLLLSDASIASATGAALVVSKADAVAVVLADGTSNSLASAAEYATATGEDAPNAALFSMADLTIGARGRWRSAPPASTASPPRTTSSSRAAPSPWTRPTTASAAKTCW
nr:carbohydrate-binding domain-containing protein [Propioniciclava coleopterorum]